MRERRVVCRAKLKEPLRLGFGLGGCVRGRAKAEDICPFLRDRL